MKVIDKKKAQQDPYVAKNFRREARLLQMVRHPNILQLLEVIETDGSFYLITELCSGKIIDQNNNFPLSKCACIFRRRADEVYLQEGPSG